MAVLPNVYDYTDYRKFLAAWYAEKKAQSAAFSYRLIARRVGFKSPGHFTQILQGKTNISVELALRFAEFLKLRKAQTQYFQYMVLFTQAKDPAERSGFFQKMALFRESTARLITENQYQFYAKWYHPVIRALLGIVPVREDYAALARLTVPPILPEEARDSVDLLQRLRLIERASDGTWRPTEALVTTGNEASAAALRLYVRRNFELAKEAMETVPRGRRNVSTVTLGVSAEGFERIQQELRDLRRRAMEIAREDNADRVYQLNLQLFPVSQACRKAGARES
jgi:uncharacterized protein (TIGR02147 family)